MDPWFLLLHKSSAITIVIANCTVGTMLISIRKFIKPYFLHSCFSAAMDMAFTQGVNTYLQVDFLDFIFDWN